MVLISFIIPVYNTPINLLKKGLDKILGVGYDNYEVIIVDDGSTNGAEKICDEYAQKSFFVKTIHQSNGGVSVARNTGIVNAQGQYIVFVDPDDFIHREVFEIEQFLEKKSDVLIFDYLIEKTTDIKRVIKFGPHPISHDELIKNVLFDENIYGDYYAGAIWAKAFKKSFLIENNLLFNIHLRKAQDREFMLYVYEKATKIQSLPLVSYTYYENLESICNSYKPNSYSRCEVFFDAVSHYFESYPVDELLKNRLLAKVFLHGFFEMLDLDFFHIDNPDNYRARSKKASTEYTKIGMRRILDKVKTKDWARPADQIKYVLVKYKLWPILNVIIYCKQKRRRIKNRMKQAVETISR